MEIVISLILIVALGYLAYFYFKKNETAVTAVEVPVQEPVLEAAPPAVDHVAETASVEVQNTEVEVGSLPVKKTRAKAKAKVSKPKKTKLHVAK